MKLTLATQQPMRHRVEHSTFGSLVFLYRRPTYEEILRADGLLAAARSENSPERFQELFTHRVNTVIVGWDEVTGADDQPLPFSDANFQAACGAYSSFWDLALGLANVIYAGVSLGQKPENADDEARAKNSETSPSGPSVAEAPAEEMNPS